LTNSLVSLASLWADKGRRRADYTCDLQPPQQLKTIHQPLLTALCFVGLQVDNAALVGTTAVVALIGDRQLYVGNCGAWFTTTRTRATLHSTSL